MTTLSAVSGQVEPWFKIESGVRQGCVLAPDSFATSMDAGKDGLTRQEWCVVWPGLLH